MRAIEYAASARVAGCESWSSSSSCVFRWLIRSPSRRADGLGAEPRPRSEPGGVRSEPELARLRTQPERGDQLRVELPDGDGTVGF